MALPFRSLSAATSLALAIGCGSSSGFDTMTPGDGGGAPADASNGRDAPNSGSGSSSGSSGSSSGGSGSGSSSGSSSGGEQPDAQTDDSGAPQGASDLHVVGNTLVDRGKVVRLLGVDHAGTEYACVGGGDGSQGYAIFDGPSDDSLVMPMLTWKVNAIRLPLNEACWLGTGVVNPQYSGTNYTSALKQFVSMIRSHGMYVILDLQWNAPGTSVGTGQQPMADADNSPAFWKAVAATFQDDLGVLFDIFNEPFLGSGNIVGGTDPWQCLQDGCSAQLQGALSGAYMTAGTQALMDAVRGTGARNVVMVPGLGYTSDLSGWAAHKPTDSTGNTAASLHLYNFNGCTDTTCFDMRYKPLSQTVPIITGENGENDCAHGFVDTYMTWADGLGISYLGWAWNPYGCGSFPALVSDYNGTPTGFGQGLMAHLQSL
jgi:hypothetical protein